MASRVQITCINKRPSHYDPHERIQRVGGSGWSLSEDEAIRAVETRQYDFFVSVGGRSVDVIVTSHNGRKYLKTTADNYAPNNLLNLPEC